jgi:hypothetical protein
LCDFALLAKKCVLLTHLGFSFLFTQFLILCTPFLTPYASCLSLSLCLPLSLSIFNHSGLTLSASELQRAAPVLQTARLCSTGTTSCANGTAGHLTDYTCTSAQTRDAEWSILDTVFAGTSTTGMSSQSMELTTVSSVT